VADPAAGVGVIAAMSAGMVSFLIEAQRFLDRFRLNVFSEV
jgi:hypothetical protein